MIVGIAATVRDQRACSSFSASALFSERRRGAARLVKTDSIASLIIHANIEEITAQELSCLIFCLLFDFIRQRLNKMINYDFLQTSFLEERGLCILKWLCFSHYFIFMPLTDKINSQIYNVKQFY